MTDPLHGLIVSLDQMATVLDAIDPAATGAPTPCGQWDVQRLIDHAVDDLTQFQKPFTGGRPDFSVVPPRIGADFGNVFRPGAAALVDSWRGLGDLEMSMSLPIGERPASFVVRQQTAEFAVHAWDLATATGQLVDWDDDVAVDTLAWAEGALRPEFRGADGTMPFGPQVDAGPDASPQERLVAFFGRPRPA